MTEVEPSEPIRAPREFFERDVHDVARALLGAEITHAGVTVRISEVEAYSGIGDPGSHVYRGETPSTGMLFASPGTLYVYTSHGIHSCANLVASQAKPGAAVLLRAGEVVAGLDAARQRRTRAGAPPPKDRDLARGPGRLGQALGLLREHNGTDTTVEASPVTVTLPRERLPAVDIATGPRVGVSGPGGDAVQYPWRYWIEGDPSVSPYRSTSRRWRYAGRESNAP